MSSLDPQSPATMPVRAFFRAVKSVTLVQSDVAKSGFCPGPVPNSLGPEIHWRRCWLLASFTAAPTPIAKIREV
jgi:hypothetical protein